MMEGRKKIKIQSFDRLKVKYKMKKFRMQCWDCAFYSVYYGCPFCARHGQLNDEETKRRCGDFKLKEKNERTKGAYRD